MRRTLIWVLISLVTFALGVATAFFWLKPLDLANARLETAPPSPSEKSYIPTEQPILAFCELVNNPDKYEGRIVRISAKLNLLRHSILFLDKKCDGREKAVAVIFNTVEQLEGTINKIVEITKPEQGNSCIPEIITVGKFSRVKEINEADSWIKDFPFQFKIQEVEKVSR